MPSFKYSPNSKPLMFKSPEQGVPHGYGGETRFAIISILTIVELAIEAIENKNIERNGKINVAAYAVPLDNLAAQARTISAFLSHFGPMGYCGLPLGFSMDMVDLMDSFLYTLAYYGAFGEGLEQSILGAPLILENRDDLLQDLKALEALCLEGGVTKLFDIEEIEDEEGGEEVEEDDYEDDEDGDDDDYDDDDDDPDIIPFKPRR